MKMISNPFKKGIPSVFVVCSPFQALCGIAAIKQLFIEDYLFIVCVSEGGTRQKQIESILKAYGIEYKVQKDVSKARYYFALIRALFPHHSRFLRLFIGDYKNYWEHIIGCGFVANRADVVYLDDGNPSITLFKEKDKCIQNDKLRKRLEIVSRTRKLCFKRNFLTIYSDIKNLKYQIEPLQLNNLIISQEKRLEIR